MTQTQYDPIHKGSYVSIDDVGNGWCSISVNGGESVLVQQSFLATALQRFGYHLVAGYLPSETTGLR